VANPPNFKSWDEVRAAVGMADGLAVEPARRLMALTGWSYWTPNTGRSVVERVQTNGGLKVLGPMPTSREDRIRIYQPNSPIDRIVQAVVEPRRDRDEALREAARGNADVLDQIRYLVCRASN